MFRVALRLLLAAALGAVPSLARADVYRWVDDSGATHYATTRDAVPRRFRDAAEVIKPAPATIPNPSDATPPAPPPRLPAAEPSPPPVEPGPAPVTPPPPTTSAPTPAPSSPALPESQSHAPVAPPATETSAPPAEPPSSALPESKSSAPVAPLPAAETSTPSAEPPGAPASAAPQPSGPKDPRAEEIAQLEGQIERDREVLRQLISTPRWDSAELAADPRVREIAERMPRLQAELAALRTEAGR
ncbi:MAG TPA: hypothetical protein VKF60_19410 [Myxococcota bacterium]|nr:hypothetical protein [Myxococcota bacterium]